MRKFLRQSGSSVAYSVLLAESEGLNDIIDGLLDHPETGKYSEASPLPPPLSKLITERLPAKLDGALEACTSFWLASAICNFHTDHAEAFKSLMVYQDIELRLNSIRMTVGYLYRAAHSSVARDGIERMQVLVKMLMTKASEAMEMPSDLLPALPKPDDHLLPPSDRDPIPTLQTHLFPWPPVASDLPTLPWRSQGPTNPTPPVSHYNQDPELPHTGERREWDQEGADNSPKRTRYL